MNPLPHALEHYVQAIATAVGEGCIVESHPSIEGSKGIRRMATALRVLWLRASSHRAANSIYFVTWPAFGYFDAFTWRRVSRISPVFIVVHDVRPLRRQFGHGPRALASFAKAVRSSGITVVCHTSAAARELEELTGVVARVVPLPVTAQPMLATTPVVRVLGQYKDARSLPVLDLLPQAPGLEHMTFELCGRGWPEVAGWNRRDGFLPEDEFSDLIATSACVVLPYDRFYQSDVAVRALESGVPVVAPRHEQIEMLFGEYWGGIVREDDWGSAVRRVLATNRGELTQRRDRLIREVSGQWKRLLDDGANT